VSAQSLANTSRARDDTLVRHIYDLHVARDRYDPVEVTTVLHAIMLADVEAHGNQFPAYRDNPMAETLRAVDDYGLDSTLRYLPVLLVPQLTEFVQSQSRILLLPDVVGRFADPMLATAVGPPWSRSPLAATRAESAPPNVPFSPPSDPPRSRPENHACSA
jgi:hypothetical protein